MRASVVFIVITLGLLTAACAARDDAARQPSRQTTNGQKAQTNTTKSAELAARDAAQKDAHGHSHGDEVPAFETSPAALKSLPPTLAPDLFTGRQRLGYQAAREIPQTIAQLPCYCHCDKGFGHKSLHTCFVDDHAAHCAICIDEALLAYKLEKEQRLKPEEIRQRIVSQYAARQ